MVHVVAAFREGSTRLRVLRIGPDAPESQTDFFVLQATRARAELILTTAQNLRDEPRLRHEPSGPYAQALAAFRRDVVGHARPPEVVVLTASGELPTTHPALFDVGGARVLAPSSKLSTLRARLPQHVRLEAFDAATARAAVARLRAQGARTISVEVGPSTVRALYEDPVVVDEVCLSLFLGDDVREAARGGELPEEARLRLGHPEGHGTTVREASGLWRFQRYVRQRA